ncbi:MAG: hypothetical protein Aurels2KO_57550 [Aureliella sp.]
MDSVSDAWVPIAKWLFGRVGTLMVPFSEDFLYFSVEALKLWVVPLLLCEAGVTASHAFSVVVNVRPGRWWHGSWA